MDDQAPLNLRSLADVESPEVVSSALRQFRRRIVRRNLWIALLVVSAVGAFLYGKTPRSLPDRISHASETTFPNAVWHRPGATVQLRSVSNLGDTTGLTFVVIGDPHGVDGSKSQPAEVVEVVPRPVIAADGTSAPTQYFEIPRSSTGIITIELQMPNTPSLNTTFTVDLRALHVPPSEWRINP